MIINDQQAQMMFCVLKDSLNLTDHRHIIFSMNDADRERLYLEIWNQQVKELKNLGE